MALLRVWSQEFNNWVIVEAPLPDGFSTVKINDIFLDADGPSDTLQFLNGDHIKLLPNDSFDSVVISVTDIGDLSALSTLYKKDIVGAINEVAQVNKTYVHNQIVPLNIWTIKHDLNKFPSVTIVDSGGNVVLGDTQYVDETTITISFSSEFSGKAFLN